MCDGCDCLDWIASQSALNAAGVRVAQQVTTSGTTTTTTYYDASDIGLALAVNGLLSYPGDDVVSSAITAFPPMERPNPFNPPNPFPIPASRPPFAQPSRACEMP